MNTRRKTDGSYHRGNEYGATAAQEHVLATELKALYFTGVVELIEKFKIRERKNGRMFRANESDLRYELWSRDGNILASVELVFHHPNMNAQVKTETYDAGREYLRKNRLSEQA